MPQIPQMPQNFCGIFSIHGGYNDMMTLAPEILDRLRAADTLALQARAAAVAGDHKQARELRARMDAIYQDLEDFFCNTGAAIANQQTQVYNDKEA